MRIVLDAGHGGKDSGASGNNLIEKTVVYNIIYTKDGLIQADGFVNRIAHHLRAKGMRVIYTRTGDEYVTKLSRFKIAILKGGNLYVSIHCNASTNADANGFEVWYNDLDPLFRNTAESIAHVVFAALKQLNLLKPRAVKKASENRRVLNCLKGVATKMPAILIELGFLTNKYDASILASPQHKEQIAKAIAGALAF